MSRQPCKLLHPFLETISIGRTPKGAYSSRGRSRHLLETAFSEPLLRALLRTLFSVKPIEKGPPSQNPFENRFPKTLPRTFSEPFLERCVAVRPLRRAPNSRPTKFQLRSLGGRSLRRVRSAGMELSSAQLVHKFAATLLNTMIHKRFNDKQGFCKRWAFS